jgi:PTH1 family peptidyl-tRNA hydrolase
MSWLQKRPQINNLGSLYQTSVGTKNIMIVGLGNFGSQYNNTRHNIGFACLDYLVEKTEDYPPFKNKLNFKAALSKTTLDKKNIYLVKPLTYMNNSGDAVLLIKNFYKIEADNIIVIHDELDLPFGTIRIRNNGNSAGHNGVKSIITNLDNSGFNRIKIGISNEFLAKTDPAHFVLDKFNKSESQYLIALKKEVITLLNEYIYAGSIQNQDRSFLI